MAQHKKINSICVYCGSRMGDHSFYEKTAVDLGTWLGENGKTLVYGAGSIGLMGVVARSTMAAGGPVIGIIPEHLNSIEITQAGMDETIITKNMHERKNHMFEKSDAFIVLPGGLGSMDEFFEMLTWAQLRLHCKPIYLFNVNGYWNPLLSFLDHLIDAGFADKQNKNLFTVVSSIEELAPLIEAGYEEVFQSKSKFM
ncbi:TIGR00730 family Rossman fold protein [Temperatibacter marinus]|uniref:Cytokinin riboside 5'-monophosphate phosphoribohydrolase n=1 Tax=Temperatibacter marinus TaxID=1456591 RepID=A0AA52EG25_9PROT|nr:TIGR00730 family Rossman fold protein [Temperatibacter marinus]WND02155.1 TIGR00730 family Rossman fold protein [Temperatibacter marinus]